MYLRFFSIKRWSCDLLHLSGHKRCQAAGECFLLLYFSVNWKCFLPSFGMAKVRNCFEFGKKITCTQNDLWSTNSNWVLWTEQQPIICLLLCNAATHFASKLKKLRRSRGILSWLFSNPLQFLCSDLDHCVAGRYQTQLCTENLWPRNYRYSTLIVENSFFAFESRILAFFRLCFGELLFDGTKRFQIVHHIVFVEHFCQKFLWQVLRARGTGISEWMG